VFSEPKEMTRHLVQADRLRTSLTSFLRSFCHDDSHRQLRMGTMFNKLPTESDSDRWDSSSGLVLLGERERRPGSLAWVL
jgi:hypothetical protein